MNDAAKRQGATVKGYVRAKWRGPAHTEEIERLGQMLAPALRARVDAIGMEDRELLQVPDDPVLAQVEDEGETELPRALNGARVIRRRTSGDQSHTPHGSRRHHRMRRE